MRLALKLGMDDLSRYNRLSGNQKVAGLNPQLPQLHVEVPLIKMLNPKLLLSSV